MELGSKRQPSILVVNPNSTASMSESLVKMLSDQPDLHEKYQITVVQPPTGPKSINNDDDGAESLPHCMSYLEKTTYLTEQDAFLVACYSDHPLVGWLKERLHGSGKPVLGIFQASVVKSVRSLREGQKWGIVSTGDGWKTLLTNAVMKLEHCERMDTNEAKARFGGVETTGLNATELHDAPWEAVRRRMEAATKRLVQMGDVGAICLGCAGMTNMDETVRQALREELGEDDGNKVAIVDGVLAGIRILGEDLDKRLVAERP